MEGLPVTDLGATALLALVVLMVLTGRLVPRRALDDLRTERDYWRQAAEERTEQLSRLLVGVDTSARALEAITDAAGVDP